MVKKKCYFALYKITTYLQNNPRWSISICRQQPKSHHGYKGARSTGSLANTGPTPGPDGPEGPAVDTQEARANINPRGYELLHQQQWWRIPGHGSCEKLNRRVAIWPETFLEKATLHRALLICICDSWDSRPVAVEWFTLGRGLLLLLHSSGCAALPLSILCDHELCD